MKKEKKSGIKLILFKAGRDSRFCLNITEIFSKILSINCKNYE